MARVLAMCGSPRRGGNSEVMMQAACDGARAAGAEVQAVWLGDLAYHGCLACLACRETGDCVHRDDVSPILEAILEADAVILAAPIYFEDIAGQMKLFVDRFYAFVDGCYRQRLLPGKRALIALCWEAPSDEQYVGVAEKYCGVLRWIGFSRADHVVAGGVRQPGAVTLRPEVMAAAEAAGRGLVGA